jgi:hypothetical protein
MSDAPYTCANHPGVPTYLRCARCEKPICARCRVATPVGYRCFDCAQLTVLPTYAVSSDYYTRAALSGFGLATVVGIVWALLPGFEFWAALTLGLGVGEVVGRAANQKRGPGLQGVAVAATVWGIVVSRLALAVLLLMPNVADLIRNIPGNSSLLLSPSLVASHPDVAGLFLALLTAPFTGRGGPDIAGILFLLMAAILSYIRLR